MPALPDASTAARNLTMSVDSRAAPSSSSPGGRRSDSPPWRRRDQAGYLNHPPAHRRRASSNSVSRSVERVASLARRLLKLFLSFGPLQRAGIVLFLCISFTLTVLFVVYNERIFAWLEPVSEKWRAIPGGWLILWFMVVGVSFPPLIGYSSCVTIAGFVYGVPNGWFIIASATTVGSTLAFVVSRSLLSNYVNRLVKNDNRFAALALTLKHDGLKLLCMIRLCPLPYSLSNGGIATIPTVSWQKFMLATAAVSPKLLIHVFIGSRLAAIARSGDQMDGKTKLINYLSIAFGMCLGIGTTWFIWRQTQKRARELEEQEAAGAAGGAVEGGGGAGGGQRRPGTTASSPRAYRDADDDDDEGDDYFTDDLADDEERGLNRPGRGDDSMSLHRTRTTTTTTTTTTKSTSRDARGQVVIKKEGQEQKAFRDLDDDDDDDEYGGGAVDDPFGKSDDDDDDDDDDGDDRGPGRHSRSRQKS